MSLGWCQWWELIKSLLRSSSSSRKTVKFGCRRRSIIPIMILILVKCFQIMIDTTFMFNGSFEIILYTKFFKWTILHEEADPQFQCALSTLRNNNVGKNNLHVISNQTKFKIQNYKVRKVQNKSFKIIFD